MNPERRLPRTRRRAYILLAFIGVLLALVSLPRRVTATEPGLSRVKMTASLSPSGDRVEVTVLYWVHLEAGVDGIPLRTLAFLGAEVAQVQARISGREVEVKLDRSRAAVISGQVSLPPIFADTGAIELELRYLVQGSIQRRRENFDVTVPVLMVTGRPLSSPQDFFTAEIRVPAEHVVHESFPTVPRSIEQIGTQNRYTLALQVAPAILRWKSTTGESPLLSFEILVDLFTVAVLLGISVITYRTLRNA